MELIDVPEALIAPRLSRRKDVPKILARMVPGVIGLQDDIAL